MLWIELAFQKIKNFSSFEHLNQSLKNKMLKVNPFLEFMKQ